MKLHISNHDFSIVWEGVYYKALKNYPAITDWELKSIIDFVIYEEDNGRNVSFEIKDKELEDRILDAINNPSLYNDTKKPEKIEECTACKQKGCLTDYLVHIAPVEYAKLILDQDSLKSARQVRNESLEVLVSEDRNAAKDPADYFDYIMFSWGNCQAGDRLVMERKLNRLPNENDLSRDFTPGVRFYFRYDDLVQLERATFDGYHALKVKDFMDLSNLLAIIVPDDHKKEFLDFKKYKSKIHFIKNDCHDIWDWSQKVYDYVSRLD